MYTLIINIIKAVFFVLIIPALIGSTAAFNDEMVALKLFHHKAFLAGISIYVFAHFFIYDFQEVYTYAQTLVGQIFKLFHARIEKISYVFPIYTVLLLIFYYIFTSMGRMSMSYGIATAFAISFTFTMHIVHTAGEIYEDDGVIFKPTYFCMMSLVYLVNLALMAIVFDLTFNGFSCGDFFVDAFHESKQLYQLIISHLF